MTIIRQTFILATFIWTIMAAWITRTFALSNFYEGFSQQ